MVKPLEQLLERKMTRKEFLATLGLGAVTIFGFSNLINVLGGGNNRKQSSSPMGYGSSSYGGKTKKT